MRIESLHIEGFGHFGGQSFGPFPRPLTVVLGHNEAGKSTLLAFIRTILFGFPARGRASFYPALNGGRHGGRITLTGDDGLSYTVERFEDSRGVSLKITNSDGIQTMDESLLRSLLGSSSQKVFEAVFALGLLDLQDLNRLNEIEASAQIYAAGMGAANLPKAIKSIEDAQSKLFLKGGSTQEAAKLLSRLRDVESELDTARGDAARFAALNGRNIELEREIQEAGERLREVTTDLTAVNRLRQAWDDWVALCDAEASLRDLPEQPGFPDDAIARLERAEAALRDAMQAKREAAEKCEHSEERANAPIPGEVLLRNRPRIDQIRRQRGAFDASVADLPKRQAELAARESELRASLAELGPDWTEDRVATFDTSIRVRDSLEQQRQQLEATENAVREAMQVRDRAYEAAHDAAEVAERRRLALEATPPPTSDADACKTARAAVSSSHIRLTEYQRAADQRANAEALASQVVPVASPGMAARQLHLPAILFAAAGVVAVVAGVALGGNALMLGILLGLALIGAGVTMFLLARRAPQMAAATAPGVTGDAYLDRLRAAEEEGLAALLEAARLITTAVPTQADLQQFSQAIEETERSIQALAAAQKAWEDASDEHQRLAQRAEAAASALDEVEGKRDATRRTWREWLTAQGLSQELLPATVIDLFARAETVRSRITAANDLRHRIGAIERDIEAYCALVRPLAADHGIATDLSEWAAVAAAADRLTQDFEAAASAETLRKEAVRALEDERRHVSDLESREADLLGTLADLLAAGHASDAEQFRLNARSHADRQRALKEKADAEARLRRLSGPGDPYHALIEALTNTNPDDLEQQIAQLSRDHNDAGDRRGKLQTELGSVIAELKRLDSDERQSRLQAERAVLVEQLSETARRWASLSVARALLDRAQRKFEEERQPDVLRHAQEFFATVTGGRYDRLVSPLGSQKITVVAPDGTDKATDQLSRGTEDQLYLALRFGLIREFAAHARLPVIVDDILVNFDPVRAQRAAEAFTELSHTNQVFVFTCHPATVELFRNATEAIDVVEMPL
ncbi:MAG: AAA family ATPase, partial [Dehalococcoidia bacterium]|nr:AAA family ATPase [Dehalococcoidia bacterium]